MVAKDGVHTAAGDSGFSLTVKRNCSISPAGLSWLLGSLVLLTFGIGMAFAWFGAWPILPFAGLEMAVVAAAFYLNGRHAADYERIALSGWRLMVEIRDANTTLRHELDAARVRLAERVRGLDCQVVLRSHDGEIEVGRHLNFERRRLLAASLRRQLVGYQK